MRGHASGELLRLPVRLHGIELGRPVDLLVDVGAGRVLGLEVVCGDEVHRFLPLAATRVGIDELTVTSALMLLEPSELDFYRGRTSPLRALRGSAVTQDGTVVGTLDDLVVGQHGELEEIVVDAGGGLRRFRPTDGLTFAAAPAA